MTTYYVNPQTGSINNPGTMTKPWDTLANVFAKRKQLKSSDTLILMSGYHGITTITGINTSPIKIIAGVGQTPCLGALVFSKASNWTVSGLSISRTLIPLAHPDLALKQAGIAISTQTLEDCSYITITNTRVYSGLDSSNWTAVEWKARKCFVYIYGTNITLRNNHFFNGCGLQIGYHSNYCVVENNLMENFSSDGVGNKGNFLTFANNIVRNLHKVDANHNDLFQSWGNTGTIIKNNLLVAWLPGNKFLDGVGVSDFQGLGFFDGSFVNQQIANNEIYVDHPIGIWLMGGKGCTINNNFVRRCGKLTYFKTKLPSVSLLPSKSGSPSTNCTVTNNRAEVFNIQQTGGTASSNIKITSTAKPQAGVGPVGTVGIIGVTPRSIESPDLTYQDIYKEEMLSPIDFKLSKAYQGVELVWNTLSTVEGYIVNYKNNLVCKLFGSSNSIIIPELDDLQIENYSVIPYSNTKQSL
jgi:hypothetical protein